MYSPSKNIFLYFVTILFFLTTSCTNEIDLTNQDYVKLSFSELPHEVQVPFKEVISNRTWGDGSPDTLINLLDTKIEFRTNTLTGNFQETLKLNGSYYHFFIEKKHYILRANKGDPFVVFKDFLYHVDSLNVVGEDYKTAVYCKYKLQ